MVKNGRIDFFIDYEKGIKGAAGEEGIDISDLGMAKGFSEFIGMAFVDDERGRKLMEIFDTRMKALRTDGTLKMIYRKYGYDAYPGEETIAKGD